MTALVNPWITATLGVLAVVLEGVQQLNQWQHNWITYRLTCEALRHDVKANGTDHIIAVGRPE